MYTTTPPEKLIPQLFDIKLCLEMCRKLVLYEVKSFLEGKLRGSNFQILIAP